MLLLIDIGNTNITAGITDGKTILKKTVIKQEKSYIAEIYIEIIKKVFADTEIDACAIASVVKDIDISIKNACDKAFGISSLIITKDIIDSLLINFKCPKTAGIDRIINIIAVKQVYQAVSVVVDLGSAITIDIISENGDFIGGMIMPGAGLQLKALYDYTSKLPLLKPEKSNCLIGKNTEEAILSGVVRGIATAIDGLLSQVEDHLDRSLVVLATGGDAKLIEEYSLYAFNYVDTDLTLKGISYIYELYLNS